MKILKFVVCSFAVEPSDLILKISKFEKKYKFKAEGIIVSNNQVTKDISNSQWMIINGSNDYLDFSAYFEGVSAYLEDNKDCNDLIFLNDTFFNKHNFNYEFKLLFQNYSLLSDITDPVIIGKGSKYYSICHRNPWSELNIFIPSYFFALNKNAIKIIQSLEGLLKNDNYLGDIKSELFKQSLNPAFYNLLVSSIESNTSPYSWSLEKGNISDEILRKKALCIYFEHRLSGEIGKLGCILPTNAGNKGYLKFAIREIFNLIKLKWKK